LKPENLLLVDPNDDTSILLCDFGFARHVDVSTSPSADNNKCQTRCGTPAYVAPEVLLGLPYGLSVDLWSTGCLLYMLLGGYPPFQADNHRALFRKIRAGDYVFHQKYFGGVSIPAKRLISNLLTVNPQKRWSAQQALKSDWFQVVDSKALQSHDLATSLDSMKQIRARQRWRSATNAIRWATTARFWTSDKVSFQQQMLDWDKAVVVVSTGNGGEDKTPPVSAPSSAPASPVMDKNSPGQDAGSSETIEAIASPGIVRSSSLLGKLPKVKFENVYELKKELRKGSCAMVWEARHRVTNEIYAVKVIQRNKLKPQDDQVVLNEVAILQSLNENKYVVQLMDFYEEDDAFYLVMEYMSGGDVFDRLLSLTIYTEKDARDLVERLLKAVASIHKLGIAHRDLKVSVEADVAMNFTLLISE